MTAELTALALAALLQTLQIVLMAVPANAELGTGATLGPRDPAPGQPAMLERVSKTTGRLHRAMTNHFEALILFTIAVLVVTLSDSSTPLTRTAGWIYLAARVVYVPAYALAFRPGARWSGPSAWAPTVLMLLAALI